MSQTPFGNQTTVTQRCMISRKQRTPAGAYMRELLIGLVLSVMATAANAGWVFVTELDDVADEIKYYANPTTKRRIGNIVRIWEITDYVKPQVLNGKSYFSTRTYEQYDCAERTQQTLQLTLFSEKMATGLASDAKPAPKEFVEPESVGEALFDFACK